LVKLLIQTKSRVTILINQLKSSLVLFWVQCCFQEEISMVILILFSTNEYSHDIYLSKCFKMIFSHLIKIQHKNEKSLKNLQIVFSSEL
jgi:hypothetical protein